MRDERTIKLLDEGMNMDINSVKNNRQARESRHSRPFSSFSDLYFSTDAALREMVELGASEATKETLLKSHIINVVTAVEVYYRDMLDSIFRLCKPSSFTDKLKKLHDRSYKIDDLLDIYVTQTHPLELVANGLSFQNTKNIEKTFSIILGKSFFKETKQMRFRIKDKPETETYLSHSEIEALQDIFEERHQLIHNPNIQLKPSSESKILTITGVIMASDLVLCNFINENIDPELSSNK